MPKISICLLICLAPLGPLWAQSTNLLIGYGNNTESTGGYNTSLGFLENIPGAANYYPYTAGTYNTHVGSNSGNYGNGYENSALGAYAGGWRLSGHQNVFVGAKAAANGFHLTDINVGSGNTIMGYSAGYRNQTDYNVFIGFQSGYTNLMGVRNVFVGSNTGYASTGSDNAFLGYQAGQNNATGTDNTFVGSLAGQSTTTGQFNSFVGSYSGQANTTGRLNTFLGYGTGASNTTGGVNTFLGASAGTANTTGIQNTYVGSRAGESSTSGNSNTVVGYQAGSNLTTGSNNIIVGPKSGTAVTDGNDNVLLGYNSQADAHIFNGIAIGSGSRVATSNALILGNGVNVGIGTSAPTNRLEVISQWPNTSGLTLTNLTEASPTSRSTDQFLTVNEKGEVVKARYQLRISRPSDWSDKVFSSSYRLRSLPSVATYVAKRGHLPGIPSAEQIAKEGIDLVKLNTILLEKVEELTLYSIDLEKKANRQDSINQQQQAKIEHLERLLNQLLEKK